MDEGLDHRSRSDRWPQHGALEDRPPYRHHRPAEKEHERLPRHAGADSSEGFSVGAVSGAVCHAAGSEGSAQAPDPRQTGSEAAADSGEKERTAAPAAGPATTDFARDRTRGDELDRLSGSLNGGDQPRDRPRWNSRRLDIGHDFFLLRRRAGSLELHVADGD